MVIWYIFPVLVSCTNKNLATLQQTAAQIFLPISYLNEFSLTLLSPVLLASFLSFTHEKKTWTNFFAIG
jgi:hypothetical protein